MPPLVIQALLALIAGGLYLTLSPFAFIYNPAAMTLAPAFQGCAGFDSEFACRIVIHGALIVENLVVIVPLCILAAAGTQLALSSLKVSGRSLLLATFFVVPMCLSYISYGVSSTIVPGTIEIGVQWLCFVSGLAAIRHLTSWA